MSQGIPNGRSCLFSWLSPTCSGCGGMGHWHRLLPEPLGSIWSLGCELGFAELGWLIPCSSCCCRAWISHTLPMTL